MIKSNKIEKKYINYASYKWEKWLLIFPYKIIIKIIIECIKENIRILGFDWFIIHDDWKIQPSMEFSTDFSKYDRDESFFKAIEFVKNMREDMHYEIVLDL